MSIIRVLKIVAKIVVVLLLLVLLIISVMVWYMADSIAQPPRRDLQDYHSYWLQNADKEGITITPFACASGDMPCLFVTPNIESNSNSDPHQELHNKVRLGERGQSIRQQLEQDFGQKLLPYEQTAITPKGIVVLVHGRMGRKEDLLPVAARLVASGFVCVLLDMPAHGDSPLTTSRFGTELAEHRPNLINQSLQDMRVWLDASQTSDLSTFESKSSASKPSASELPAFIWGMSMGGSYANYAVADINFADVSANDASATNISEDNPNNWQGIIIVSSFAHLQQIVDTQAESLIKPLPKPLQEVSKTQLINLYNLFVKWQGGSVSTDVHPADQARNINLPVLQFHGNKDTTIDISQGRQLFASYASEDKTWVTVTGAGHNNVLVTDAPVYATMADWLLRHSSNDNNSNNNVSVNSSESHTPSNTQ